MTLPSLPAKHQDLVPWIHNHPDTPINELIKPYNEYENVVRKLFAQEPSHPLLQNNHLNIAPLYNSSGTNDVRTRARNPAAESPEVREKYVLPLSEDARRPDGSLAVVSSLAEFKKNFNIFSEGSLSDMDWSNVVVAGSAVVTSLLPVPEEYRSSKRALRQFYHDRFAPASDVDLFLYGLTEDQAIEKIKVIEDKVKNAILYETTTVRTKNTVTIVSQYPTRHVQIVLRIYKSVAEILTGFDVDCSCAAFDGDQVYVSPRALAAYVTQTNQIDLSRRSPSYENRLSKYSHRGFEVFWPALQRERVDPTIFERSFSRTVGLARLLVLEKLPKSSDREEYMDQRRRERGRPARAQRGRNELSGNIKGDWEDETPEWMEADEISEYHTVTIPYGPRFHAKRIEKLLYTKDLLLNAEWNQPKDREVNLHRHPAFFGNVEDVIHDCCGYCPEPVTPEEKDVAEKESKTYISGEISFIQDDPGRQEVGSFNPITETDWTEMAYIGNTERLCHAIVDHDLGAVKEWLAGESADPNSRDYTGRAPLHLACMTSTPEIVQCLVDHGARLTARVADGRTSLHLAAARGSVEIVRILLHKSEENEAEEDRKAELRKGKVESETTDENEVAGERAADESDIEIISHDGASSTTGSFVKVEKEPESSAESLPADENEQGPDIYDVNVVSWDSRTSPLHLAILHGHVGVVEELVSSFGADVLLPIKLLYTYDNSPRAAILTLVLALRLPLDQAKEMTAKLLQLGATPTQADMDQNTPVHFIAASSYTDLLDVFLNYNKPATQKALGHIATNGHSWNPTLYSTLMVAIAAKDSDNAIKLLELGVPAFITYENWLKSAAAAMPQIRKNQGDTNMQSFRHDMTQPVIQAISEELPTVVLELLERGADPNTLDRAGYEIVDIEYRRGYHPGKSVLDLVRDKLLDLREYKGEKQYFYRPCPLESDEVYFDGLEDGTYKMWLAKDQVQRARSVYAREWEVYEKQDREFNEREGIEEKKAAIDLMIQQFERVEQVLLDKKAKTFVEMYPDLEVRETSRRSSWRGMEPEPFKLRLDFRVPDLTDEKRKGYFRLFEAAWTGDRETVQMLTLGMWGEDNQQQPLQVNAHDVSGMSPFAIAVVRGHLEMAKTILEIAQAQYKVVETKNDERYEMDDASDDGDEICITSEIVDDKFTVDDIGALDFDAGSTASPTIVVTDLYPLSAFQRNAPSDLDSNPSQLYNLFEYAIRSDDLTLLTFLLELGQQYQQRDADTESRIFTVYNQDVHLAIELGRLRCLEEIITRTGADLPLNQLVKRSGVQVHEKPKYYQGLSIHGRKRADWAAAGRGAQQNDDVEQCPPLLVSAFRGSLSSTEWFLGTAPARHYLNFAENHEDKRLKLLAQSADGVEKSIINWLNTRNHLVLHCAVMSKPTAESKELIQYIISHYPEYMEKKSLSGHTPLALAYSLHRVEFAELLIHGGANQTIRDREGNNLVHLMLCSANRSNGSVLGEPDNVTKLLDLLDKRLVYSMFTERSSDGPGSLTPLARWLHRTMRTSYSSSTGNCNRNIENDKRVEIVRALLSFAEPTGQKHLEMLDGTGNTPVHDAVKGQLPRIFELMIDHRPDLLHRENSTGTTPLELAVDAWVAETTANPPFLPTKNYGEYWETRMEQGNVVGRAPHCFVQSPPTSERKLICDMSRARVGASEKRKLVSLNEANEVAKRLAVQSETRGRARRCGSADGEEGQDKPDEVMLWYERASQF